MQFRVTPKLYNFNVKLTNRFTAKHNFKPNDFEQQLLDKILVDSKHIDRNKWFDNYEIPMRLGVFKRQKKYFDDPVPGVTVCTVWFIINGDHHDDEHLYECVVLSNPTRTACPLFDLECHDEYIPEIELASITLDDYHKKYFEVFQDFYPKLADINIAIRVVKHSGLSGFKSLCYYHWNNTFYPHIRRLTSALYKWWNYKVTYQSYEDFKADVDFVRDIMLMDYTEPEYREYAYQLFFKFADLINEPRKQKRYLNYDNNNDEPENTIGLLTHLLSIRLIAKKSQFDIYHYYIPIGTHYYLNNKLHYTFADTNYININDVMYRFPDLINNPWTLKRVFDSIMPFAIKNMIANIIESIRCHNMYIYFDWLFNLGSAIGVWASISEYGNGCNAWLLHYPFTKETFRLFIGSLFTKNSYLYNLSKILNEDYLILRVDDHKWADKVRGSSYPDVVRDLDRLFNEEIDIYSITEWAKEFIDNYPFLLKLVKHADPLPDVFVPAPSGFTLIPWMLQKW